MARLRRHRRLCRALSGYERAARPNPVRAPSQRPAASELARSQPPTRAGTLLRPILMTTMMLVLGMIPIALGQGPGAGSRSSIARVIVGGQMLSLVITLLITPVAYSLFDDLGRTTVPARVGGWLRASSLAAGRWLGARTGFGRGAARS